MEIKSYAKINLALKIVGIDPKDRYHLLEMVNVPISLFDVVSISINDLNDDILTCSSKEVPLDKSNLVLKAINLLRDKYKFKEHFNIDIQKNIPLGGGVAGGSSNASSALIGVTKLLNLNISEEELSSLAFKVGADVPYCLVSKPSIIRSKGEIVEPFEMKERYYILLLKPHGGCSTKEVYQRFDSINKSNENIKVELLKKALIEGSIEDVKKYMGNDLENPAFEINPEIKVIKDKMMECELDCVQMTGSGSCLFALSKDKSKLEKARQKLDECGECFIVSVL